MWRKGGRSKGREPDKPCRSRAISAARGSQCPHFGANTAASPGEARGTFPCAGGRQGSVTEDAAAGNAPAEAESAGNAPLQPADSVALGAECLSGGWSGVVSLPRRRSPSRRGVGTLPSAAGEPKRLRLRLLAVAGRMITTGRRRVLRISRRWSWALPDHERPPTTRRLPLRPPPTPTTRNRRTGEDRAGTPPCPHGQDHPATREHPITQPHERSRLGQAADGGHFIGRVPAPSMLQTRALDRRGHLSLDCESGGTPGALWSPLESSRDQQLGDELLPSALERCAGATRTGNCTAR